MSEDTNISEPEAVEYDASMHLESPDTFSFFDVLEEVTYPKDEVTVWTDERAVFDFKKLGIEVDMLTDPDKETIDRLLADAQSLQKRIEDSKYTFKLTGVSDDRIEEAAEVANKQFEDKKKQRKTAHGTIEKYLPEAEQLNYVKYFNAVVMSLHIEQIIRHKDGRVMTAPSPDEVAHFFNKAPGAAKADVNDKIQSLRLKSSAYESSLDEGFFQKS